MDDRECVFCLRCGGVSGVRCDSDPHAIGNSDGYHYSDCYANSNSDARSLDLTIKQQQ